MSQLLRSVLSVIEIFHKYAREDCDGMMLTYRELKQLLQGEFEDILQPQVIQAVERSEHLLAMGSDGISFEEFVLTICNLLNSCYIEIQLLNSEQEQGTKPEKEKTDDMDLQAASRNGQQTEKMPSTQDKVVLASGMIPSSQLKGPVEHNRANPQEDSELHDLPKETSKHKDCKNMEGEEHFQEVAQDVQEPGDNEAQLETKEELITTEQTHGPTKEKGQETEVLQEGDKPAWERSGSIRRGQLEDQEGNLGTQSSPVEETAQRPSKDHKVETENGVKEYSKTQTSSLQVESESSSERAGLPEQGIHGNPPQTQRSADSVDDGTTSETQEPERDSGRKQPESEKSTESVIDDKVAEVRDLEKDDVDKTPQETKYSTESDDGGITSDNKEQERKGLTVHGDSGNVSETQHVQIEGKLEKDRETYGETGQKERERKTQVQDLEVQISEEKYEEFQGPSKTTVAADRSDTQDLSSGGKHQSDPEIKGATTPGKDFKCAEKAAAEAFVGRESARVVGDTLGARETTQESVPLENQSEGKIRRIAKTQDKPVKEDASYQGEDFVPSTMHNDKGSYETLAPEGDDSCSETGDLPAQEDSQSRPDSQEQSMQAGCSNDPDDQRQAAPGDQCRVQEAVVLAVRREAEPLIKEQECGHQNSGTKEICRDGHSEAQLSKGGNENRKSAEIEISGALDTDDSNQLSVAKQPPKGEGRNKLKIQVLHTREEDGAPQTQETPLETLHEDNSGSPETEEAASLQEEDKSLQELTKHDEQHHIAPNGGYASVPESGLKEEVQKNQRLCSVEKDSVQPSPLYNYLQEKILQQVDTTQEEHHNKVELEQTLGPELNSKQSRVSLTSEIPNRLANFDHSSMLQQHNRDLSAKEAPADPQQTSQAGEDKQGHPQRQEPLSQEGVNDTKQ